jgi:serine/threonine-protein phosphatase 2A regulatory subunit B
MFNRRYVTGSYNNNFVLHNTETKSSITIEALKDPPHSKKDKKGAKKGKRKEQKSEATPNINLMDFGKKALHVAWHPRANAIAVAGLNKLYIYQA